MDLKKRNRLHPRLHGYARNAIVYEATSIPISTVRTMKKRQFQPMKPVVDLAVFESKTECPNLDIENMDPVGYFLIRIDEQIEVGLCSYKEINVIKKLWTGKNPQNLYRQIIKDIPRIRKDHCAYLGKELARAWICMVTESKYVQDGNIDGTFPEVKAWKK